MYVSTRHENADSINFKIPWDKNTAKGFVGAVLILSLILFLFSLFKIAPPIVHQVEITTIPLEILNFGAGDGTGKSKGNLTEEGTLNKGKSVKSELEDAQKANQGKNQKNIKSQDPDNASNYIPKNNLASKDNSNGSNNSNTGNKTGSSNGTGLGEKGSGAGKGLGYGDIEWGGGGNRIVLQKKLPVYPPGVNTSAQIKIRFVVLPDGTVSPNMIPLQKGEPILEKAAMDALRQWRFNKLNDNKEMSGIITFTFKLS